MKEIIKAMPINILDAIVIGITLISSVLAAVRGATRELLAIASWFIAGAVAYFFHPMVLPYTEKHITHETVALAVTIVGLFLLTLLIVSFITVKISDMVLDSRIGAVDRTLGFLFGVLRGFLLCVIGWAILNWFLQNQNPEWAKEAKTLPTLQSSASTLVEFIPEDVIKAAKNFSISGKESGDNDVPQDSDKP